MRNLFESRAGQNAHASSTCSYRTSTVVSGVSWWRVAWLTPFVFWFSVRCRLTPSKLASASKRVSSRRPVASTENFGVRWTATPAVESREAADQELPTGALELIGKQPDLVEEFDLEASVEGRYADEALSRLGLAFD